MCSDGGMSLADVSPQGKGLLGVVDRYIVRQEMGQRDLRPNDILAEFTFETTAEAQTFHDMLNRCHVEIPIDPCDPDSGLHGVTWCLGPYREVYGIRVTDRSVVIKVSA